MADKQPSFAERTKRMRKAAIELALVINSVKEIGEVVAKEADCMTAAEKRFTERNANRTTKASR